MIQRPEYLDELKRWKDKDLIKVVTGIRSYLLGKKADSDMGHILENIVYLELLRTGDYYPKILLTLDMDLEVDYNGITKINVVDWLLKEE